MGNENAYNYPNDPINRSDTTGLFDWMLALDIALIAASFIPGVGVAALAAKVVITAVRVVSAVSKVAKASKVVKTVGNVVKGAAKAKKAKAVTKTKPAAKKVAKKKSCNSFTPGTLVLMGDGSTQPIENVQVGDLVIATDPITGETTAEPVTDLITGAGMKDLVRIGTDPDSDGTLDWVTATAGHPFWVAGDGWTNAGELTIGDMLIGDDRTLVEIHQLDESTQVAVVHNLTVSVLHTYYTMSGGESLLVHNETCGPRKWLPKKSNRGSSYAPKAKSQKQAEEAAEQARSVGGRCRTRGTCASGGHVHVDYINRRGQISHTRHFPF